MPVRVPGRWTYRGERARADILDVAARIAVSEGLHRVTLGRLAKAAGVSKSGLFEHFGSVEELHASIVTDAVWRFERSVLVPARGVRTGMPALYTLLHRWLVHMTDRAEASAILLEVGPGRGRDVVAGFCASSMSALRWEVSMTVVLGQIQGCDAEDQLAFELHAPIVAASWWDRHLKSESAYVLGVRALDSVLNRVATPAGAEALAGVRADEARWLERRAESLEGF
jgi:AcrR family transcriptional regulator